jgi:hypothetical protein
MLGLTDDEIAAGVALMFLMRGRLWSSAPTSPTAPASPAKTIEAADRIAGLVARATQIPAQLWVPNFEREGVGNILASGLARWIGIESSGNPLAVSSLGERGLLQCTPETAKLVFSTDEWNSLNSPTTLRSVQARLALKQYRWHWARARTYIDDPPGDDAIPDQLWYAKLHHERPADLSGASPKLHGPAQLMARELAVRWRLNAQSLLRLAAANVVAWGSVNAP